MYVTVGEPMTKITEYSAINVIPEAHVDAEKWNKIPSDEEVVNTILALQRRGIKVIHAKNRQNALDILKTIIPQDAEVMVVPLILTQVPVMWTCKRMDSGIPVGRI